MWKNIVTFPLLDFDYYLKLCEIKENIISPYVLLILENNHPKSIVVGIIEKIQMNFKVGYKVVYKPYVKSLTIDESGIIGEISNEICAIIIKNLSKILSTDNADLVKFNEIKTDSKFYKAAIKKSNIFCRDYAHAKNLHYKMTKPDSLEDFLKGKKRKKNLKSIWKRLEKKFDGNVKAINFFSLKDLNKFLKHAKIVSEKSIQVAYGYSINDNLETKLLLELLAKKGILIGYILYIKDQPCSYYLGFNYERTLHLIRTGYDPDYRKFQVGTALLLHMIDNISENKSIDYIDFGSYDMFYKKRYCDIRWEDSNFYIFAPSFKGIYLNSIKTVFSLIERTANKLLSLLKLKDSWLRFKRMKMQS